MSKKVGAILLAVLLAACATAVGMANDGVFSGGGDQVLNGAELEENDEGPPPWAAEHARERWEWAQRGEEGPPPWAAEQARNRFEGSENDEDEPPAWVMEKVKERQAWSEKGEDGPPPWAKGKGKGSD